MVSFRIPDLRIYDGNPFIADIPSSCFSLSQRESKNVAESGVCRLLHKYVLLLAAYCFLPAMFQRSGPGLIAQ